MDTAPLTVDDLAARWAVNGAVVRRMLRDGKLRGFRVGTLWRVPVDAVREVEQCGSNCTEDTGAQNTPTTAAPEDGQASERRIVALRNGG